MIIRRLGSACGQAGPSPGVRGLGVGATPAGSSGRLVGAQPRRGYSGRAGVALALELQSGVTRVAEEAFGS